MAIRKIARMGHPVLRQVARQLTKAEILSPEIRQLVQDLMETMVEYRGIGIAAPQVHESVALALIDFHEREDDEDANEENDEEDGAEEPPPIVVINPKITVLDDQNEKAYWEGCLSVPEIRGLVYRPQKVQIDYLDLNAKPQTILAEGFRATVFQHELDHLFGVLFVDRIRYSPGKSPISFIEEYQRYLTPKEDDEEGELDE
jgi:peptide deformylase